MILGGAAEAMIRAVDAELDPTERRLIGVMIEKQLSTPDAYPLSLNALVVGANQKTCREPVMALFEWQVEGALASLLEKKWATYVEGGRVRRWKHRLDERLMLTPTRLAVMAELLLRGSQQPAELRRNAERLARIPTEADVQAVLDDLAARTPPLVKCIGRAPRERDVRWSQMLAPDTLADVAAGTAGAAPTSSVTSAPVAGSASAPAPEPIHVHAPVSASASPSRAASPPPAVQAHVSAPTPDLRQIVARIEALERSVAELKSKLGAS